MHTQLTTCNKLILRRKEVAAQKNHKFITLAVILLVVAIVLSSFVYLNSQKPYTGNIEPITLGVYPSEYNSLIYIANDQKFFNANGLNITLKNYVSGAAAAKGMLNEEVDVATASEFVIVSNALNNASICALGSLSRYLNLDIIARTDRGINSVSDLVGKKIGVTLGTANQFYLGRYLELYGINQSQVTVVNYNFVQMPDALANGTIDAAITFQPYINQIQNLLGDRIVVWPAQAEQFGYFESICTRSWATAHPDLVVRFLKAVIQAENFNAVHRDQAIAIVANDLNYTNEYTASVWPDYEYSVMLDQSFILLMQDEARWLINNNLTSSTSTPNFLDYIYVDGLKSVRSESVNIIGLGS
jgi:ABC-type nitrate/sulfonate/bicarbonate transport system substrate-binding protein